MAKKLIIANWKTAPDSLAEAETIINTVDELLASLGEQEKFSLIICPPFVFIEEVARMLGSGHLAQSALLGAQDIAPLDTSALTGEVSGSMLVKLGVRYVIVGHSERRWKLGESDEVVNKKLRLALDHKLTPIVCIGEHIREGRWHEEIVTQVQATFAGIPAVDIDRCLIAYEPIWAISTASGAYPDTPVSALQSIKIIRETLNGLGAIAPRFLYGGSVTESNASKFLAVPEFSGVLIGGPSVRREEFLKILTDAIFLAR